MGPDAKMMVAEFLYAPSTGTNSALVELYEGTVGVFAGAVAKHGDMKVGVPNALLSIHGGSVIAEMNGISEVDCGNGVARIGFFAEHAENSREDLAEIRDRGTGELVRNLDQNDMLYVINAPLSLGRPITVTTCGKSADENSFEQFFYDQLSKLHLETNSTDIRTRPLAVRVSSTLQ